MDPEPIRLSQLDSGATAVLRVVAHFDALVESSADAETIIRSAESVAQCPLSVQWVSATEPEVRLERAGSPRHPLDEVLLDRVRHALRMVASRAGATVRLGDPALLELVLSDNELPAERARAIRLLGLDESREVRVLAVSAESPAEALRVVVRELGDQPVRSVTIGADTALLCYSSENARTLSDRLDAAIIAAFPPPLPAQVGRGPWVGIGAKTTVFGAATSWQQAQRGLRFASSTHYGRRAVAYERLSVLELLADLPSEQVLRHHDVARINALAATPAGAHDVDTTEAFCVLGSLRRTATQLHLHHSTVAARIAHVEAAMGWDLADPVDRFTATLVLFVRRIALSSAELTDGKPTIVGQNP
ncbi:PucR family transcriptional regulator [[Mycobacterium] nativiensis]|uniref:Helix-turn-helix domain-containing protein n=1 Tax=[Mycobacterium] nativiensis TaxID=2855503 RepID=A0ABU5Y0B2_9MYCO|nr:helix-turn-helix domain-containing protein [Mycolicibacter sp. MYC340]MEB3032360.1 helix-turn-helix domain-containing protein [Mycolicibacter sp. MYC340]